ncbi:LysR family transcriptional regulator [Rhodococcus sp. D2-41]|uniref:LysR family transcriptional regulator n=1 Tax=Speluncibacter jeojiensis TaxID=2710754 RepID=UPI002410890F|nr:LysR family transcriptional regulator [Rhodococcus sp. D2-41]MDG3012934.1 LysR family transcriptional regulator [Rhodococcus sp. D2-41]
MDQLRHWQFFVAVAEEGHFGAAADRLGMTQPPVSQGLRRLEAHLGVELIERSARGAVPTAAGRSLLPRARGLVRDAERLSTEAHRLSTAAETRRCGFAVDVPPGLVTACLTTLRTGGAAVAAVTGTTPELVQAVAAGEADGAVVEDPAVTGPLDRGALHVVSRVLVVPPGHPTAAARRLRWSALRGLAFACLPRSANPPGHDRLLDALRGRGLDPEVEATDDDRRIAATVAAGSAFGIVRPGVADEAGLPSLALPDDDFALRLRVVTPSGGGGALAGLLDGAVTRATAQVRR